MGPKNDDNSVTPYICFKGIETKTSTIKEKPSRIAKRRSRPRFELKSVFIVSKCSEVRSVCKR